VVKEVKKVRKVRSLERGIRVNISRISTKGQVTIPMEIRRLLGLKEGDKVVFLEKDGNVMLVNSNLLAWRELQQGMIGEAERVGWKNEEDVVDCCKKIRQEMWEERNGCHD
jgi:AbrB family looped-hinge helix DNA binding protein